MPRDGGKRPSARQIAFLLLPHLEAFYGGAAGGGKSDALLMAALQYVDQPRYSALLLRRSYTDLALPGAIMDRAAQWLGSTDARWNGNDHQWTFPSGATLSFGYLKHERDKYRYQSSEFQFIAFDELTQFTETQYKYMFSRLRRLEGAPVPLRVRSASNPGGEGHEWVKHHLVDPGSPERPFIRARLEDNPGLDRESYARSLAQLDPITREQLRRGDWSVRPEGAKFRRTWFEIVDQAPAGLHCVRFWDLASTEPSEGNPDPDWSAGVLVGEREGVYWVLDVQRTRERPLGVERLVAQTAQLDGRRVDVWIEQEPGASGKSAIDHYQRRVLKGFTVRGLRPTGPKDEYVNPLSAAAEAGNVKLVRGPWNGEFLNELAGYPEAGHDDQVDAAAKAVDRLTEPRGLSPADLYGPGGLLVSA